jgi:hypothetical protein
MQLSHVQTLEVIGGVPPLRMRFSMLNHGYLISAFKVEFSEENSGVQRGGYNSYYLITLFWPDCPLKKIPPKFGSQSTPGSKGEAGIGFGVYQLNFGEFSFRLREPSGVVSSHQNCRQFLWPWSKLEIPTLVNSLFYRTA